MSYKKDKINKLINEFNLALSSNGENFNGIYLFGSYAMGNQTSQSDVDLVFLFKTLTKKTKTFIFNLLSDLMYKYDIFIDVKIMDDSTLKSNPFFYNEITTKGIFYGRTK